MMQGFYLSGDSWIHRMKAGHKLLVLLVAGWGLMWVMHPAWLLLVLMVVVLLYGVARVSFSRVWLRVRSLTWFLLVIGIYLAWLDGWHIAVAAMLRLASLLLLGLLVTLTTPLAAMMDVVTSVLRPLERLGLLRAERVSLAFGMTLRMVPELYAQWIQIREAQAARGLESHPVALIVPMLVRTLKRADDMAEAIDARMDE